MILLHQINAAVLLLSLTLGLQVSAITALIEWLKRVLTRDADKHGPILRGQAGSGINDSHRRFARARDSSLGRFLPVALLPVMGNRLSLFSQQLFHRRVRGCGYSAGLATPGASGKFHRCVDVRNIRQCSVCSGHATARPRHTVLECKGAHGKWIACPCWRIEKFGGT